MSNLQNIKFNELNDTQSSNITGGYYGGYSFYRSEYYSKDIKKVVFNPEQIVSNNNPQTALNLGGGYYGGSAKNNGQNGGKNVIGDVSFNLGY